MWLTNSSVGRKMVMGITGLFLVLFVTFHVLMNAVALFSPEGYNAVCRFLGANWYAILGTLVLAAGFVIHIIYSFWLTLQNRRARGNDAYQVSKRPANVEWASQNMLVLGIIVPRRRRYAFHRNDICRALGVACLPYWVHCFVVPHDPRFLERIPITRCQQQHLVRAFESYFQRLGYSRMPAFCH